MDILTKDGTSTITQQQFIALHPSLAFPQIIPYADFGYFVVHPQGQSAYDPITQSVHDTGTAVKDTVTGEWLQVWAVTTVSAAEQAARLAQAQAAQIAILTASYTTAIAQAVSYTSKAGVTKTYQADPQSVSNLQAAIAGCSAAQATPTGFYWVAADNSQVPFAFADLQGLASAMFAQGAVAFQHLQTLKAQVNAASTVPAIQAVTW
jgi:hypothetical protein